MEIHNDTDNTVDTNEYDSSFQNKWYSRGFPSNTAWGWNKAAPKKSLYDIGMAHTANTCMLKYIPEGTGSLFALVAFQLTDLEPAS